MKLPSGITLLLGLTFFIAPFAMGQETAKDQRVQISDWPASAHDKVATDSLFRASGILPLIDELTVGYSYGIEDNQPAFNYNLQWKPGDAVYLDGNKTALDKLQGDVLIESIVLQAEVIVEGVPVTLLTIAHDSLMSRAMPGYVSVEMGSLAWATIFADTDAATAQLYFEKGFELGNAKIASISFVYFEEDPAIAENEPAARRPRSPSRRTIFRPGISIWIDFPFYGRRPPPRVADVDTRTTEPRGDRVGRGDRRTEGERSSSADRRSRGEAEEADDDESTTTGIFSGNKKKKDDDDDEEDEGDLLPAALAGVAAVAAVAVIGGTVGYYGNTQHTPIGLMTGYVHPKGGLLLQVAVNEAVLQKSETDTEYFMGRVVGFYDFFKGPVQPALGAGVLVSQQSNEVDYVPSISPGLAGNFGSFILLGGYDVLNGGLDFGVAYNFRARR